MAVFGAGDVVARVSNGFIDLLAQTLTDLGFAPSDHQNFAMVARFGWAFLLAGFRGFQLLGLVLYVLFFPLVVAGLVVGRFKKSASSQNRVGPFSPKALRASWQVLRVRALAATVLLGWFLAYAGSTQRPALMVGWFSTAVILVTLAVRAIDRVRPATSGKRRYELWWLPYWADSVVDQAGKFEVPKTKAEFRRNLTMIRWQRIALAWIARRLRPRAGATWRLVVLDFILWPILLLVACIVFWAFGVKYTIAPDPATWELALRHSASHFLPGLDPPAVGKHLPFWLVMGAGLSGYAFFGLYVTILGSTLLSRR